MKVSIVVIGLNEGAALERALRTALAAQLVSVYGVEVLYCDAGSDDGSVELARALGVRTLQPERGRWSAAEARNAGWRASCGEWVQFLDGDMGLDADWIDVAVRAGEARNVAAVGGELVERRLRASVWNHAFGLDWAREPSIQAVLGGAALWSRAALEELEGFDTQLPVGEDPDLSLRAHAAGWRVLRIAAPMADHDLDLTSAVAYFRRARSVGRSRALVAARHPEREGTRRAADQPVGHCALLAVCLVPGLLLAPLATAVCASLGLAALVARTFRRARQRGLGKRSALVSAIHVHAVKLPMALGVLGTRFAPVRAGEST